ncbi:hypothetical protein [Flavihumibacter fluvii]|uniref:hypothetical protein n=1 Tax=Flavihumibacter fluvii TaxID=2838157 RepID=UPI001BDF3EA9|nr:hypothetical protein [Flavihumibacter fluvii]ULQ52764.1 hypothetical protein KJS93_00320 [Flavihumibacter fluvii]
MANHVIKKNILNDKVFYGFLVLELIICSYSFYNNEVMAGILQYYYDFSRFFKSGFSDSYVWQLEAPTFPMWGYGVILTLTSNKLLIIFAQQLLFLFTVWFTENKLKKWYRQPDLFTYRILVIFSFCLFFFNSILWPYGFNSMLLFLALLSAIEFIKGQKPVHLYTSGALIGLALNLRSDFIYFVPFLFIITFLFSRKFVTTPRNLAIHAKSLAILILLITPWMIHSYHKTGHVLVNSTNAGHVLYISLGQLPDNKWKITPLDGDSSMADIVKNVAKEPNSCTFKADSVLKKKWLELVVNDPAEYARKCINNVKLFIIKPFYTPDFYTFTMEPKELQKVKDEMSGYISGLKIGSIISTLFKYSDVFLFAALFALINFILNLFFWFNILKYLLVKKLAVLNDYVFLIAFGFIFYQVSFQTLAYYFASYHTNLFLTYVFLTVHTRSGAYLKG